MVEEGRDVLLAGKEGEDANEERHVCCGALSRRHRGSVGPVMR